MKLLKEIGNDTALFKLTMHEWLMVGLDLGVKIPKALLDESATEKAPIAEIELEKSPGDNGDASGDGDWLLVAEV